MRVGFSGIQLPHDDLTMSPGQVEHTIGEAPIVIFFDQAQADLAAVPDAGHQINGD